MNIKIITSSSSSGLTKTIKDMFVDGWEPIGSHSVVVVHSQNRYAGNQHMDTIHETEYSITMIKADPKMDMIKVDVAFYHPNDDETIRVYDEEGMRE